MAIKITPRELNLAVWRACIAAVLAGIIAFAWIDDLSVAGGVFWAVLAGAIAAVAPSRRLVMGALALFTLWR